LVARAFARTRLVEMAANNLMRVYRRWRNPARRRRRTFRAQRNDD